MQIDFTLHLKSLFLMLSELFSCYSLVSHCGYYKTLTLSGSQTRKPCIILKIFRYYLKKIQNLNFGSLAIQFLFHREILSMRNFKELNYKFIVYSLFFFWPSSLFLLFLSALGLCGVFFSPHFSLCMWRSCRIGIQICIFFSH